jgi:hypothetical protein
MPLGHAANLSANKPLRLLPPAALSDCAARRRGGDFAILLILSRRRNATKVSTLRAHFKIKARWPA